MLSILCLVLFDADNMVQLFDLVFSVLGNLVYGVTYEVYSIIKIQS